MGRIPTVTRRTTGFRFRKRISLWVHINLSATGSSLSVGRPGMTVNLGGFGPNRHPRLTVGIPGSGLSYQTRLDGPRKRTVQPVAVLPVNRTVQPPAVPPPVFHLSEAVAEIADQAITDFQTGSRALRELAPLDPSRVYFPGGRPGETEAARIERRLGPRAAGAAAAEGVHIEAEPARETVQQKARRFFFAAVTILAFVGLIATIVTARSEEQTRIYAPDGRSSQPPAARRGTEENELPAHRVHYSQHAGKVGIVRSPQHARLVAALAADGQESGKGESPALREAGVEIVTPPAPARP
jgi:Protein of unknown function (DUF4236)